MPFEYGVETIVSLPSDLSSEKSLFGRSYETSASPRSSSALLFPASGTMRQITRLILRQRAALPVVVAFQYDLRTSRPVRDLKGATADGVELGIFEPPGILFGSVLFHQPRIEDTGYNDGEIGNRQPVLFREIDAERMIIDNDELPWLSERPSAHLKCGEATDRHSPVE